MGPDLGIPTTIWTACTTLTRGTRHGDWKDARLPRSRTKLTLRDPLVHVLLEVPAAHERLGDDVQLNLWEKECGKVAPAREL